MAYASIQDYIDCFSEEELICLTDVRQPRTETYDITKTQCALDDACSEIEAELACCGFDLKKIKRMQQSGSVFSRFKRWNLDIARYLLHDKLCNADGEHEASIRYRNFREQIAKACECGIISDTEGNLCCTGGSSFVVTSKQSCLPRKICSCGKTSCCCRGR